MNNGCLLIAFNNQDIDYIKLAEESAKRASYFLNVPVSLITDNASSQQIKNADLFDKIIIIDNNENYNLKTFRDGEENKKRLVWKNTKRDSVYDLTPYDNTLVLDVDFFVNSKNLVNCWNQPYDFLIYKNSFDLATWRNTKFEYIGDKAVEFYWATVFFFRKNKTNKLFFELVKHIKNNWSYYNFLYQLSSSHFRNDFAFSIAIHIMNGYNKGDFAKELPGKLFYILDTDHLLKIKNQDMYFLCGHNQKKYQPLKVSNLDVHIMNKYSLLRNLND